MTGKCWQNLDNDDTTQNACKTKKAKNNKKGLCQTGYANKIVKRKEDKKAGTETMTLFSWCCLHPGDPVQLTERQSNHYSQFCPSPQTISPPKDLGALSTCLPVQIYIHLYMKKPLTRLCDTKTRTVSKNGSNGAVSSLTTDLVQMNQAGRFYRSTGDCKYLAQPVLSQPVTEHTLNSGHTHTKKKNTGDAPAPQRKPVPSPRLICCMIMAFCMEAWVAACMGMGPGAMGMKGGGGAGPAPRGRAMGVLRCGGSTTACCACCCWCRRCCSNSLFRSKPPPVPEVPMMGRGSLSTLATGGGPPPVRGRGWGGPTDGPPADTESAEPVHRNATSTRSEFHHFRVQKGC